MSRLIDRKLVRRFALGAAAVALVTIGTVTAVQAAGRDPAYNAARTDGKVGEKMNGYLGIVGAATPELRGMVDDINIKRKAVYAERAQAQHATVEEYAFTSGCQLILQTSPGEKYQAPDGSWQTRGNGPPLRDNRCP
ncbi:MAG: YdbL family protein [Novosphingobium sp.]|nr:YdbL family protein [Novosphingobium sp.]